MQHTAHPLPLIHQVRTRLTAPRTSYGDHTVVETPVPIPNTVVKHSGPMIVRALAKVGIARFFKTSVDNIHRGLVVSRLVACLRTIPGEAFSFGSATLILFENSAYNLTYGYHRSLSREDSRRRGD